MQKPSAIVKAVYWEHIRRFGEPSRSLRYDNPPAESPDVIYPPFIDVMVWEPEEDLNMTTFTTIGMCDKPMATVDYRVELHFSVEGPIDEGTTGKIATFLANLSLYPFMNKSYFDWWHTLPNVGAVPGFPSASAVFLHPSFVKNGWDIICTEYGHVKIMNVVPITKEEHALSRENGINGMLDYLEQNGISYFARR